MELPTATDGRKTKNATKWVTHKGLRRSTTPRWRNTCASEMRGDTANHTQGKHSWKLHNKGVAWDTILTMWVCEGKDWVIELGNNLLQKKAFMVALFKEVEEPTAPLWLARDDERTSRTTEMTKTEALRLWTEHPTTTRDIPCGTAKLAVLMYMIIAKNGPSHLPVVYRREDALRVVMLHVGQYVKNPTWMEITKLWKFVKKSVLTVWKYCQQSGALGHMWFKSRWKF